MPGFERSGLTFLAALSCVAALPALAQGGVEDVVLSVTPTVTRWAAVYREARADDPYVHARVFEKRKGTSPWVFRELADHLVVTPEALAASRIRQTAKTWSYKDVEFRMAWRHWREDAETRRATPVCRSNILACVGEKALKTGNP